jgi:LmbE family N-acetylglucosaminyl deacetylase
VDVSRSAVLSAAVAAGDPVLVLSAHLDDAVLSCGALLSALVERCPVTVVTLFTAAAPPPHTRAARSFLRQCAVPDAAGLFAARRAEDGEVLSALGVTWRHLGVTDALFRSRRVPTALDGLGRRVPELVHRYPTYRYDIAKGRVSRGDRALPRALADELADLDAAVVLAPIGVGLHVDHLITRRTGELLGRPLVRYSDFPYDLRAGVDRDYVARNGLDAWSWDTDLPAKERLIRGYSTQVDALFAGGEIPLRPEIYFEPTSSA